MQRAYIGDGSALVEIADPSAPSARKKTIQADLMVRRTDASIFVFICVHLWFESSFVPFVALW
jgi:hypothetical protein